MNTSLQKIYYISQNNNSGSKINWWQIVLTTLIAVFVIDRFRRANSVKRMINFTFKSCSDIYAFRYDSKEIKIQNFKFISDCYCHIEKEFESTRNIRKQLKYIEQLKMLHYEFYDGKINRITPEIIKKIEFNKLNYWFVLKILFRL